MRDLVAEVSRIRDAVKRLRGDPKRRARLSMPGNAYFLESGEILALPRERGDSRYPYGKDGFNFWACASGYMHANEGLFSLFLRAVEGQEPTIAFFAGLPEAEGAYKPVPLLMVPQNGELADCARYTVFTTTAVYYITELGPLSFGLRVFVTPDKRMVFSMLAENAANAPREFFLSSFLNPYLRHQIYESSEDRWFKEIRSLPPVQAEGDLGSFLVSVNEDTDRHHSVTHHGVLQRRIRCESGSRMLGQETTTSRYQYVGGSRGSLHTAAALRAGTFGVSQDVCCFTETAVAADLLRLSLAGGGRARYDLVFSTAGGLKEAEALAASPIEVSQLDQELLAMRQLDAEHHAGIQARVSGVRTEWLNPDVFNAFFDHLKRQVEFCSLIKGYVQLSVNSLIGIRDVFQALEAFSFWQPQTAAEKMLEALDYTSPDGRCYRQYSLPSTTGRPGRMDLRRFIDQGCWIISAVAAHLKLTGDIKFLSRMCGYHEVVSESAGTVRRTGLRDTVLDHLFRILDDLLSNRDPDTGCIRMLYGDWNDALDGLGISNDPAQEFGSGVSVMATLQVYQNLIEMAELLEWLDADLYDGRIEKYRREAERIRLGLESHALAHDPSLGARILHGWGDKQSYQVGGFNDPDGKARDGLTSNAFWILSGLWGEEPDRIRRIVEAAYRRLDSKYGFKTFEPHFEPNTPGVGRIGKLPAGTAENGATYVHATAFAVMSLFRMGRPQWGWEQLQKILPFTPLHRNLSHSPFVMPNAYGFNPDKRIDGQNMNDWQTGSSNVLFKLLVRDVFGFEPGFDGFWIQPAAGLPFDSFTFRIRVRGAEVSIHLTDRGVGRRRFRVNGAEAKGVEDPLRGIQKLWVPYQELCGGRLDIEVEQ